MKKLTKPAADASVASAQVEIESVVAAYETALNASDTDKVIALFAPDGVFMAPNNPSTVGSDAIREAYTGIFQTITFRTELSVDEITLVAQDWAIVRTNSNGSVTVKAINQQVPDANHELFAVQQDDDGKWKIARYCFSTTLPLRQ